MSDDLGREPLGYYMGKPIYDPAEWWEITSNGLMFSGTATIMPLWLGTFGADTSVFEARCAYCKTPRAHGLYSCPQCGAPY